MPAMIVALIVALVLTLVPNGAMALQALQKQTPVAILPDTIIWGPNPATPPGGQLGVILGSPAEAGPYAFRLKFPTDYKVMPHTHPEMRMYTVISGTFYVGLGDTFDPAKLQALPAGAIYVLPARTAHFHWTRAGESIVQVNGLGPTATTYVNAADDPRKKQ